jgi:hypothetical protein
MSISLWPDRRQRPRPPVSLAGPRSEPVPASAPMPIPTPAVPLRLTDEQLNIVMRAAEPLASADRGPFLEAVAGELQGLEIGDGIVARTCAKLQKRWFTPPTLPGVPSKWRW